MLKITLCYVSLYTSKYKYNYVLLQSGYKNALGLD